MKKKVIAYLHTHWDKEWYREFEIFRLRLIRVFDNVLNLLINNKIPCFYFDGQISALTDYLEINPEKTELVKKLISEKKLFIGPCYTLIDEFLTDGTTFRKNLEIGLKIAKSFGCKDFIGYFADTFGHSKNIPKILKEFGIDKSVVWRGCNSEIPSEFMFNGIKTVNIVRGYFNDYFSCKLTINEKAKLLNTHLDKIAIKSSNTLLMPIGADHLGIEPDIAEQIKLVNEKLENYEIILSSPFEYFKSVDNNFKNFVWNDELRDNSETFILQGCYSARTKIKKYNTECSYKLNLANIFQKYCTRTYKTKSYDNIIEYAYKLLLQNEAHDGICGCSTDEVHQENITRYKKILQISNTIIEELKLSIGKDFCFNPNNTNCTIAFESEKVLPSDKYQKLSSRKGVEASLFYDTQRIPVTEDFKKIYTYLTQIRGNDIPEVKVTTNSIENLKIKLEVKAGKINLTDKKTNTTYKNVLKITDYKDNGDTYNFGAVENDKGTTAEIISSKILYKGSVQSAINVYFKLKSERISVKISLNNDSDELQFYINWNNRHKNHLLQIQFREIGNITKTFSEDMNTLLERDFDQNYEIRKNLPKEKGIEAKTNTAPFQRYLHVNDFNIITKGLTEYEIKPKSFAITILRAVGIISNPKNPSRSTPAGPPIFVPEAQQLGQNSAEFCLYFGSSNNWEQHIEKIYPQIIINKL